LCGAIVVVVSFIKPKAVIPFSMLFASDLPVLGCGIETGMAKMLLKQPQPVTGGILLHGMKAKGITQAVRADTP